MTKVSMVIIAFNEQSTIADTIASIRAMNMFPTDHEILVIDDGSTDATADVVTTLAAPDHRLRIITQANAGRGAARANGVKAASNTEFIGFVDADILLPPQWWTTCAKALEGNDAVGGVAVPDGDVSYVYRLLHLQPKVRPHTTTVSGGNGLFRKSVFDKVAFDPAKRSGEDIALNHAMQKAGLRTATLDDLLVEHEEIKSFFESCAWLFESGIASTRQLFTYRQWRKPDSAAALFLFTLAGSALTIQFTPWACAIPIAFIIVVSATHIASKFEVSRTPLRAVTSTVVHSPLITCYLVGRLLGIFVAGRRRE